MKFRPVKSGLVLVSMMFLSFFGSTISPLTAHADIFTDWTLYNGVSEGYFSNGGVSDTYAANRKGCGETRCPVVPNGNYSRESITGSYFRGGNNSNAASIERAYQLVADLKTLHGRGGWSQSGSAFIVNTMLGYGSDSGSKSRNVSGAMWQELQNRLVDRAERGRINWNVDFSSNGRDTYTRIVKNQWDVVYDTTSETRNGILIYSDAGVEAYRIWYECGNPVGVVDGVPLVTPKPKTWSVTPSVSTNQTTVRPGQTVNWTHTLRNNGPDATQANVGYRYESSNGLPYAFGSDSTMGAGTAPGGTTSFNSTYVAKASDADKVLCRSTSAAPRAWDNGGRITSGTACVRVVNQWTIGATSTVTSISGTASTTVAKPNDLITWKHEVRNNGPDATRSSVTFQYENANGFPAGSGGAQTLAVDTPNGGTKSVNSSYRIVQDDVDKTLCRVTTAAPRAWNNSSKLTSSSACVRVPYNYTLTPTLTIDKGSVIETPSSVNVTPRVTNSGPTKSRTTQWQLVRIDIVAGRDTPRPSGGVGAASQSPCSFFAGSGAVCSVLERGNSVFNPSGSTTGDQLNLAFQQINELPVGSKICFAMSVQPVSSDSTNWSHSAPTCLKVAKKPKVQVLGSDLIVGRATAYNPARVSQVSTSTSYSGNTSRYYGSWSEYAIIPSGTVSGMASGAMYVDGTSGSDLCSLSVLTVSNSSSTGCQASSVGRYVSGSTAPYVASRFPVTNNIGGASINLKDLTSERVYSVDGASLNISSSIPIGSNGAKGKWVVINDPDATVTITTNINYTAPAATLTGIDDIPQVVIIARNIIIAPGVTNVDAWLIAAGTGANGYINTCGSAPAAAPTGINSLNCEKKLTINGPIMANKLYMYRTAGAGVGVAAGEPAEVFNLRADAYFWASVYSNSTGRLPTVSTKELPPRF